MRNKNPLKIIFLMNVFLVILPNISFAHAGSLDTTFGINGIVITPIGSSDDRGRKSVLQNDGKIVVIGASNNGSNDDFAVVRYNTDGSLDSSFDNDGKVTTAFGPLNDGANSVAIQNDGKIVVAGYASNGSNLDFAVARYNTDGSLDTTFDNDGKVTMAIGNFNDQAMDLALQIDGKIIVVGFAFNGIDNQYALARFNTNGSIDTSFDSDGRLVTNIGTGSDRGLAVEIQSDNKIVVGGVSYTGLNFYSYSLARYNSNGSLDSSFDTDGKVMTSTGSGYDLINDITIQSDGKIVAVGNTVTPGNNSNFAALRYNTNGSLDSSFGINGIADLPIGSTNDFGQSVVVQSDNKIIFVGQSYDSSTIDDFALIRLSADGSVDSTFGNDGKVTTPISPLGISDIPFGVLLQDDGKILLTGYTGNNGNYDFAVARYSNDISLGLDHDNYETSELEIFPNPFSNTTTIRSAVLLDNSSLSVFNLFGQLIRRLENLSGNSISFNRDNLSPGVYLIRLTNKNKVYNTKTIIVN